MMVNRLRYPCLQPLWPSCWTLYHCDTPTGKIPSVTILIKSPCFPTGLANALLSMLKSPKVITSKPVFRAAFHC